MARGDGELELTVGVRGAGRGAAAAADAPAPITLGRLILAGMVAGGVQYGWALQLSLLTPYVQVYMFDARSPFLPSSSTSLAINLHGGRACAHATRLL
jgi:hypothetical protein